MIFESGDEMFDPIQSVWSIGNSYDKNLSISSNVLQVDDIIEY